MQLFDYECLTCGVVKKDVLVISPQATVSCPKDHEGGCHIMRRQPAAPAFKVEGFNAKNGYATGETS